MEGDLSRISAIRSSEALKAKDVSSVVKNYTNLFNENEGGSVENRKKNYASMVNDFYDMVTQFYEFGWGESFHFAPRHKWETFAASIARLEFLLAHKLELKPGQLALDLGSGVGGPGRNIARFSEARLVGLNNNEYQIERSKLLTEQQGLSHLCTYLKADWMDMPFQDNHFNAVFHVEAIEHSPDRGANFREILRVLKPGGLFGGFDWVVTDKFDPSDPEHVRTKKAIELGNGLPDLVRPEGILAEMKEAGFEVLEAKDYGVFSDPQTEIPWWDSLEGKFWSIPSWKHAPIGRFITNRMVWALESVGLAPKGTLDIHNMLNSVASELVKGGEMGIFSPSYFYLARKPLSASESM